jgi:hypothetical protein
VRVNVQIHVHGSNNTVTFAQPEGSTAVHLLKSARVRRVVVSLLVLLASLVTPSRSMQTDSSRTGERAPPELSP